LVGTSIRQQAATDADLGMARSSDCIKGSIFVAWVSSEGRFRARRISRKFVLMFWCIRDTSERVGSASRGSSGNHCYYKFGGVGEFAVVASDGLLWRIFPGGARVSRLFAGIFFPFGRLQA